MLFYGVYGLDAGAMTPILYGFRERERIQSLFESVTGARMMHNYIRVGGVNEDLPGDFGERMRRLTEQPQRGHRGVRRPVVPERDVLGPHQGHRQPSAEKLP